MGNEIELLDQITKKIIVALDFDNSKEALRLVSRLKDHVGAFKIGLELFTAEKIRLIKKIRNKGGKIFLDLKFHDIPNTVAGATRVATRVGVSMLNVHISGGTEMMKAARRAAEEESSRSGITRPKILGVTVLTSINPEEFSRQNIAVDIKTHVMHLAKYALEAGLDGVICSPKEVEHLRKEVSNDMLIVTPGIRPKWAASNDQKRITTPSEAILKGASYLVIGRPITSPPKGIGCPVEAVKKIKQEIFKSIKNDRRNFNVY